jgi:tetratricopeptide (TPR) repeat protein
MDRAVADRELEEAGEAFGRGDLDGVIAHLSAAIRGFTDLGLPRQAALASARMGDVMTTLGQPTAARVWIRRAERLVADLEPCIEQGWVALMLVGCEVDDPAVLLARAERALDLARRFGDLDLEAKALADGGLAHVQAGRVAQGMAMLDEAMALAAVVQQPDVAGKSICSFFTACYYAGDVERFGTWTPALRQHGLISAAPGVPAFLSGHCDAVQANLLVELGRWTEATELLERAIAQLEAVGMVPWHPAIGLAGLRALQGRWTEAEALLLGREQSMDALLPSARLHLARGDHRLATAAVHRGLATWPVPAPPRTTSRPAPGPSGSPPSGPGPPPR